MIHQVLDLRAQSVGILECNLFVIFLLPLVDVDEDRELLSEARYGKHVVIVIPVNIGHHVLEVAPVFTNIKLPFILLLPDIRLASLTACNDVASIWRERELYLLVATFGAEEPLADLSATGSIKFNQSDAVVARLDVDLLQCIWVRRANDLVDLVALDLFVPNAEVVDDVDVWAAGSDSPDVDCALTVTDEQRLLAIEAHSVRVLVAKNLALALLIILRVHDQFQRLLLEVFFHLIVRARLRKVRRIEDGFAL